MKRLLSLFALPCASALLLSALLCLPAPVPAQVNPVPPLMSFQGRLAKPDGTAVADGVYSIRFSLWDAASGGTEKWNQTLAATSVRNGAFAVLLSGFSGGTFNGNLWLEIKVGTDTPITPRQPLVSVAYAMKADSVRDGGITNASLANGSLTADKFAPGAFNPLTWLLNGNSGVTSGFLGTIDSQPLAFRTNNVERMRILPNGNIGIGTITPTATLQVSGAGDQRIRLSSTTGAGLDLIANNNADAWLRTTSSVPLYLAANGSSVPALAVLPGGNIGIGTSTPGSTLDINGTARMTGFKLPTGASANTVLASDASGIGTWQQVTSAMIQSLDWSKLTGIPSNVGGWGLTGNAGTSPATNFLGTTDNQLLVLRANNLPAFRLEPVSNAIDVGTNVVGGINANFVTSGASSATIAGGGAFRTTNVDGAPFARYERNIVGDTGGTVGGGMSNTAGTNDANAFNAPYATVGGGYGNTASGDSSTVSGGFGSRAQGKFSVVPGGNNNRAFGDYSLAAGQLALANHTGTFVWADSQLANFASTGVNQFLIRAAGGVGINTNAPTATLHVSGAGDQRIRLTSTTGAGLDLIANNNVDAWLRTTSNIPLNFGTNNGFTMMLATNGNVGIGTTTPGFPLSFADTLGDKISLYSQSGNNFGFGIQGGQFQIHAANSVDDIVFGYGSSAAMTENMRIRGNGNAILRGTLTQNSDGRWKKNVATFDNALDAILNLRGVTYEWKEADREAGRQIGFIAQEVEKVLPELVQTDKDGYKSVAYANVVPVLVEAVKTLKHDMESRLKAMDTRLKEKDAEIEELKAQMALVLERLEIKEKAKR